MDGWMKEGRTNGWLAWLCYGLCCYVLCSLSLWMFMMGQKVRQADVLTYRSSFLDKGLKGFYEFVSLR